MSDIKSYKEHWEKIDNLSGGGQGTTIKALSIQNRETISAVKILNKQNDLERRARMQRETVALSTLDHYNIPKVLDSNTEFWREIEYKLFIATEFIPGNTLSNFDISTLTLSEKIQLITKISEIIGYCHQRGIVHRDIKPDNIILRKNAFNDPVILDFGISFNFNDNDDDNLTPDGQHLGNRFLILPEQKVGEAGKRDLRTDITCLVGIFYFILSNEAPIVLEDENEQKPHQRYKAKQIIDSLPSHIKSIINNIFDIGFNQLIDKRWQTIKSLIDQFYLVIKIEAPKLSSPNSLIDFIKSVTNQQTYQESKALCTLLSEATRQCRDIKLRITKELGDDWSGGIVMGGSSRKYFNDGYSGNITMGNTILGISINTFIKSFVTGNELVIHSLVEGSDGMKSIEEVYRQPIQSERNWEILEAALRLQYLNLIAQEIQKSR